MVLAWENFQRGFCDVGCCSSFIVVFVTLVVVLHSLLFDVIPHPSVSYRRVFTSTFYFQPSSSQGDSRHFYFNFSGPCFHIFTASRFRVGIFCERRFFTLRSFPTFLPQPAFIKVSLVTGGSSLKFA